MPVFVTNAKKLSDDILLLKTEKLVRLERRITVRLIEHLQEVDRRRLHLQRGVSSLYDYLIRGLGYSGGAAHRRIQAMEVCRDLPEVTHKIESGQINLTQAMQLQGQLEKEERLSGQEVAPEVKRELLSRIEGLSTRETEKVLASRTPEAAKPDNLQVLSGEQTQISFAADEELMRMLERIKELTAHQNRNPGLLELFKLMAKKTLERLDPLERAKRARSRKAGATADMTKTPAPGKRGPASATFYELHRRSDGQCQFVDGKTKRRCLSRRAIQSEHRTPYAKGGRTELGNLEAAVPRAQSAAGDRGLRAWENGKVHENLRCLGSWAGVQALGRKPGAGCAIHSDFQGFKGRAAWPGS